MRKQGFFLAAAVAAALSATCLPVQAQDIGIGLIVPLSPPGDPTGGQLIRRGAEMGIDAVNNAGGVLGGRKFKLYVEDSQGKPEAGVAAYRRLVSEDKVVFVPGFFHSSVAIAANEVAKDMGVPTMSLQASAAEITSKHYETAFRTHAVDQVRVATFMELIKKKGFKRISMIAETTDYGIGIADETIAQAKKVGGLEVQKIAFDRSVTDLTPQLLQVKAFKPDLVINIGVGQPCDLIIDQATTIGLLPNTPMIVSYDAPARPQFWKLHEKNGAGIYFIAYYSPKTPLSDIGKSFAAAYTEKYKEDPVYGALNGYGAIQIIAQAINAAKSTDSKALIKTLETGTFKSWPDAPVTFPRAEGVYWHNWVPPVLILHYTKPMQDWKDAEVEVQYSAPAAK
ncbi:branched-chain amino acid transport system substrate-binding protein [Enhydrobacter aerosaccus]|uniref:Branched-chain amino acid transport system substrate-binding protein n=1 Tax=Enhydrobacter aerosaccus TaxID=225324 RepID=A0A1T4TG99_9HYPH|nr:ABC transporter substrate-binding protein [Enhydrobacter aerosaccus]SKA39338.1 branched-chain amino acid transport system substrate-binding protein [Enhydrobacter aerosaccus]